MPRRIIDFDEGYVFYFTDGNGSGECDRIKIDEGDLNEGIVITYHAGGEVWKEYLHFKWKNQPDHLIVYFNGVDYDYYTTSLEDALKILASRNIIDY